MFKTALVTLFTKPGCHLCEEAKREMVAAQCSDYYSMKEVNIQSDPELLKRYALDIPVVTINGIEEFRHRVTSTEFRRRVMDFARGSAEGEPRPPPPG
jgi:glutaredoxin